MADATEAAAAHEAGAPGEAVDAPAAGPADAGAPVDAAAPAGAPSAALRAEPLRRRTERSLRARLAALFGIVAVFLAVMLVVQLYFQDDLASERDHLILRVDRAAAAVGDLRAAVVDQETGVRGYALTRNELFLEPYERGLAATDDALGRLTSFVDGTPAMEAELADVEASLAVWRTETAEPGIDPATADAASSEAALEAGREQFEALRTDIDALDAAVDAERAEGLEGLDRSFGYVIVAMLAQLAGVVVLGIVIMVALNRLIVRPLAYLGADARLVAQGLLDRRVEGRGAPELVRMGEDVDAMRVRIVDELAQLRRTRAELELQAAELVRSNEDLEQFAYVASHDLQEPLRKVSGFCQLLEKRYADQLDERAKEYIAYATDGARRMQDLINDLLAFSRVGRTSEGFVPVDLGELASEVVSVFESRTEGQDVTITVADDMPVVSGDRRLIGQVLQNLVGNALKFRRDEPAVVEVSATDEDDHWVVTVSDNGIGIDPAYADQIFTIFKRLHTKTEYEGTGIGLALSKKIVEFHGGRIWLEPSETPGATFRFSLPHAPAAAGHAATEESQG